MDNLGEDAVQRSSKLHGLARCEREGVVVDPRETVVHYQPWTLVALGDDSQRGDVEILPVANVGVWEHRPIPLPTEVKDFFEDKRSFFVGGLVGTARHRGIAACHIPGGAREDNVRAVRS